MMRLTAVLVVALSASVLVRAPLEAGDGKKIVAYYTAWSIYARAFPVSEIPADRLTHINYAFANIVGGECVLGDPWADVDKRYPDDPPEPPFRGNFGQLARLKERHSHVRTLISVGGWTWSGGFSDVAATDPARQRFARSCVTFMTRYGFDGVDIDWEYPVGGGLPSNRTRPEDRENFTALLAELREQLDDAGARDGRRYLLTIAAPAGPSIHPHLQLGRIHAHLDWINLMTYDFIGGWSPRTGFNAPLFPVVPGDDGLDVNAAVEAYLAAGVPAAKLHLGVPFYGRGWRGVPDVNRGLGQAHTGVPAGTWEAGVFDYSDLVDNHLAGAERFWHDEARVPWLFNAQSGVLISYDDPESLREKARFASEHGLGGVMVWELSSDDDDASLLTTLRDTLRDTASVDHMDFLRGDCDGDGEVAGQVTDAVFLLTYNFLGGPAPPCLAACDADGDGHVIGQVADAVFLLVHNFLGGPQPAAPFPDCGTGARTTDEELGCDTPLACP